MRKKAKPIVTRTASELAAALNLPESIALEWEIKSELCRKIISGIEHAALTHAQLAHRAGTSRSRVTAILNGKTHDVSIELLLRVLASLGYRAKLTVSKA